MLRKLVALMLLEILVLAARAPVARAVVSYQVFSDRAAFDAALGSIRILDFDDIDTAKVDPVSFSLNRYKASTSTSLLRCLAAEHLCQAEPMTDKQAPRVREFGAILDVLPESL